MKHTLKIVKPDSTWMVEIEPDKDIAGMVMTTFSTNSLTETVDNSKMQCPLADWEHFIKNNLSRIIGNRGTVTILPHIFYTINRAETETEKSVRRIFGKILDIKV